MEISKKEKERRRKIGIASKKRWATKEFQDKQAASWTLKRRIDTSERQSKITKARYKDPMYREFMARVSAKFWRSDEGRELGRNAMLKRYEDPKFKRELSKKITAYNASADGVKNCKRRSKKLKKLYSNRVLRDKVSSAVQAYYANPDNASEIEACNTRRAEAYWSSQKAQKMRRRMGINLWKNMSAEKRAEVSLRISEGLKAFYETTPEARKEISTRIREDFRLGKRKPPTTSSYNYHSGWITTKKAGRIFHSCGWELDFIRLLESSNLVKKFTKEPFGITYTYKAKNRTYFPDYLVEYKDGTNWLVELKGPREEKRKVRAKFKAAYKYCKENGLEWVTIYEKPTLPLTEYLQ